MRMRIGEEGKKGEIDVSCVREGGAGEEQDRQEGETE